MPYAVPADLDKKAFGLPQAALTRFTPAEREAAIGAASDVANGYLGQRYTLPLTAWGDDLRLAVCSISAFNLMGGQGFNPDGLTAEYLGKRHDDAVRWLERVARGMISPPAIQDSTPPEEERADCGPLVESDPPRGWGR